MQKLTLTLLLTGCSLFLAGCPSQTVTLDSLCEARAVPVSPEIKAQFRAWLTPDGKLKANAPMGAADFLKGLKANNDLIRHYCSKGAGQ
ncbi:hypothetical protein [Cohaesibacter haloalkalitolerans]|uniref:hypothetical protein n=1 Tax=Cohaesibacter haloalkalitolerans TaxID=1162980 RepID=UPI0013C4AB32|nr:hypothetical protein [Cohaesibacter haloalkalitolerans]